MSEENVSLPVAQALASALEKIEAYVPTEYVDNSEPDIDAEHLNHAEQGIMRVTNLLNAAVDVIQGQESRLADAETKIGTAALTGGMTDLSSGLNTLNSNLADLTSINRINVKVTAEQASLNVPERTGVYYITGPNIAALPSGFSNYGILFNMRSPYTLHPTNTNAVYTQIYIDVNNKRATRTFNNGKWADWNSF